MYTRCAIDFMVVPSFYLVAYSNFIFTYKSVRRLFCFIILHSHEKWKYIHKYVGFYYVSLIVSRKWNHVHMMPPHSWRFFCVCSFFLLFHDIRTTLICVHKTIATGADEIAAAATATATIPNTIKAKMQTNFRPRLASVLPLCKCTMK